MYRVRSQCCMVTINAMMFWFVYVLYRMYGLRIICMVYMACEMYRMRMTCMVCNKYV